MTSDVTTRGYRLHALIPDNPPVGLDIILSASRTVRLNGFSQESAFRAVGMNKYQVSVSGYPYNAMTGKKIAVYFRREEGEEEWVFSFIERQNGYIIDLANSPRVGWRVSESDGVVMVSPLAVG